MKNPARPAIFKWRQTAPELILCAVRWYLRYSLSLRDVEELLAERGLEADHTTIWRWVQRYGPELERRLRRHLKPTNQSWRADETYVRVSGRWCYLYRAIDSAGATIDFLLSALRDADAAKGLFRKALSDVGHPQPRVINTDQAPIYGSAIPDIKKEGTLRQRCRHRPVQYLNNVLEQDHRAFKSRVNAKQGFREFQAARRTIQGYEAMHMIRKGQARWVSGSDVRRQIQFINRLFENDYLRSLSTPARPCSCQSTESCNTTGTDPGKIRVGDFNGDGNPDIAVAVRGIDSVSILLGNGRGGLTSAPASPIAVGRGLYSLLVHDLNGDGIADIATTNWTDSTISVLLGSGNGSFRLFGTPLAKIAVRRPINKGDVQNPEPSLSGSLVSWTTRSNRWPT